jgi:hypothetical protein
MGVQLNIKDEVTVRLARKLADARGKSVTETVRELLEREEKTREEAKRLLVEKAMAIAAGLRGSWKPEFDGVELSTRHGDFLYDDDETTG